MKNFLIKLILITSTGLLSVFIYANVVEKVLLMDFPIVPSVSKTTLPKLIHQIAENKQIDPKLQLGFYGTPRVLRVPRLNFSINLQESKKIDDAWVLTNGVASIHIFEEGKGGNMGDSVVFALPQTGLLAVADVLVEGDRVVVDTDSGWRYNFRVIKRIIAEKGADYLVSHSSQTKLLLIREKADGKTVLVETGLMNVEELTK